MQGRARALPKSLARGVVEEMESVSVVHIALKEDATKAVGEGGGGAGRGSRNGRGRSNGGGAASSSKVGLDSATRRVDSGAFPFSRGSCNVKPSSPSPLSKLARCGFVVAPHSGVRSPKDEEDEEEESEMEGEVSLILCTLLVE